MSEPRKEEPLLLSREDAAALIGISVRHFERHVAPHLARIQIGTRVLFAREDVIAWLEKQKAGPSTKTPAPACGSSGSVSPVVVITDRRAQQIAQRLRRSLERSFKR